MPMPVERFFEHKGRGVLKLGGLNRFEDAQAVVGAALLLPPQDVGEEPEGVFDPDDLPGRAVLDATRGPVGTVSGTRKGPAYWYIEAQGPRGTFEFPAVAGLGVEVPRDERVVRTDLPGPWPGLDEREGDPRGAVAEEGAEVPGES
jgi:ribosomal 30S subunit maturation factor RimM